MAGHTSTNYTDRNNIISGTAGSLEAIREPSSRYDFGIKWAGADGVASVNASPNQPSVGLVQGVFPMQPDVGAQAYRNGYGWDSGDAVISIDWAAGTLTGTIKELYYGCSFTSTPPFPFPPGHVDIRTLIATRDNVDPGFDAIGTGRIGQNYSFIVTGTEFRIYNSREVNPVVILASPPQGPGYPLSLGGWVAVGGGFRVTDIRIVRVRPDEFSTIYSLRDRIADSNIPGLHARIYQNATLPLTVNGVPTDIDSPTGTPAAPSGLTAT